MIHKNIKINSKIFKSAVLILVIFSFLFLFISCEGNTQAASAASSDITEETSPNTAAQSVDFVADGIISNGEYSSKETYGDFEINWKNDGLYIYAAIKAKAKGYLAVAIQPGNRMKDADMILGYVKDGSVSVFDLFSTGDFGPHLPDTELGGSDDITESGGSEDETFTIIEFKRLLLTDDKYDNDIADGKNQIIWAFSNEDDQEPKHSNRGYGEIEISLP